MKIVTSIEFHNGSNEERLPDYEPDFPCITSCAVLSPSCRPSVPWHWHKAVELVYIKSGMLEYQTPKGRFILKEGNGALVNSNILHATALPRQTSAATQLLHLFDPVLLAGTPGSRIDRNYIRPLVSSSDLEYLFFSSSHPDHQIILNKIRESFEITPDTPGYELLLRDILSQIWFQIFTLVQDRLNAGPPADQASGRVKLMMGYIHEHYAEPLCVKALSLAAICSERECYRAFAQCLHMTPSVYLQNYRLQMACRKLTESSESLTVIAHSCGFSSSSYFGKVFRAAFGMTPMQYRTNRQNRQIPGQ